MIKIYLDWNVISQMKNGQLNELKNTLLENDKFLLPYSTSHIGDLLPSLKEGEITNEFINSDLNFISELTKNSCLINTGKDVVLDIIKPQELFKQKNEERNFDTSCACSSDTEHPLCVHKDIVLLQLLHNYGPTYFDSIRNWDKETIK